MGGGGGSLPLSVVAITGAVAADTSFLFLLILESMKIFILFLCRM